MLIFVLVDCRMFGQNLINKKYDVQLTCKIIPKVSKKILHISHMPPSSSINWNYTRLIVTHET